MHDGFHRLQKLVTSRGLAIVRERLSLEFERVTHPVCRLRHLLTLAPADYLTAEQVDHHSQEQPTLVGGDVRDFDRPDLVLLATRVVRPIE